MRLIPWLQAFTLDRVDEECYRMRPLSGSAWWAIVTPQRVYLLRGDEPVEDAEVPDGMAGLQVAARWFDSQRVLDGAVSRN